MGTCEQQLEQPIAREHQLWIRAAAGAAPRACVTPLVIAAAGVAESYVAGSAPTATEPNFEVKMHMKLSKSSNLKNRIFSCGDRGKLLRSYRAYHSG